MSPSQIICLIMAVLQTLVIYQNKPTPAAVFLAAICYYGAFA